MGRNLAYFDVNAVVVLLARYGEPKVVTICVRLRPAWKDHVWAYDFVNLRIHDGTGVRLLTVIDEYSRACLAIRAARSIRSADVIEALAELMVFRGVPDHIRSDNGPAFTARAVREWLGRVRARTLYIEPGSP